MTSHIDYTTPAEQTSASPVQHQFQFTGKAGEFFKIWIVNLALTIVTLGIYSAWAKVRTNRYFYGNTKVAGHTFSYLAKPISILIGKLVLMAILIASVVLDYFYPGGQLGVFGLLFLLLPLLVVRSLTFRLRNTAYRTVRFGFVGTTKKAYVIYGLGYLATVMSFGLAYPVFKKYATHFSINNSRFGQLAFTTGLTNKQCYAFYAVSILLFAGCVAPFALLGYALFDVFIDIFLELDDTTGPLGFTILIALVYAITFAVVGAYMLGTFFNLLMNTTTLGENATHTLRSTMPIGKYIWIFVTNALLTFCTLGLLYPWARVRLAKYRAAHCSLISHGGIDSVIAQEQHTTSALGEEIGDYMDADVGF